MSARDDSDVAIIGMAGRFPGAADVAALWRLVCAGTVGVRRLSPGELRAAGVPDALATHQDYVPVRGILDDATRFDAAFFGYSPRDAATIDPQQRVFLECAWAALEDAGYACERRAGLRVGVFAGCSASTYLVEVLRRGGAPAVAELELIVGNDKDHLATRVAYELDLRGPAYAVQTSCSTSLVAVHLACQALLAGECDVAIAGGASIRFPQAQGYRYEPGSILSRDGYCRPFDRDAGGTVMGSGAAVVALTLLGRARRAGDPIHAVIKGSATNNDGSRKLGYAAPSVDGQRDVIRDALAMAGVPVATIGYVEAHGTGTALGDPIEVAALAAAFDDGQPRRLGSIKGNVGHLDAAAGATGLIKAALAVREGVIPPTANFRAPNPQLPPSPFVVSGDVSRFDGDGPRRAGVSSFGIGGTNAHVIVEAPPSLPSPSSARTQHLLVLSARSDEALQRQRAALAAHLEAAPQLPLGDVAHTLQARRAHHERRWFAVVATREEAIAALRQDHAPAPPARRRDVVFLFPGQGAQHVDMLRGLAREEPRFAATLDECLDRLRARVGLDLRPIMFPDVADAAAAELLRRTEHAQPALFCVEYALARLWMSLGARPTALVGHSIGELVAAALADVLPLDDALALAATRGRLVREHARGDGLMLSVRLSAAALTAWLGDGVELAAVNGAEEHVVSGPAAAVTRLAARLHEAGIEHARLFTSHAFHSALLDPVVPRLIDFVAGLPLRPPSLPYLSNVTGDWMRAEDAVDPRYWGRQLRAPVRFADALARLSPDAVRIEVGPGRTLARTDASIISSARHARAPISDAAAWLRAVGCAWQAGAPLDLGRIYDGEARRGCSLPTYPFGGEIYTLLDGAPATTPATATSATTTTPPPTPATHARPSLSTEWMAPRNETEAVVARLWSQLFGLREVGVHDNFYELGGHSLVATQLRARLEEAFPVSLPLDRLFNALTVADQAALIEELMLERLAAMSDDEAADGASATLAEPQKEPA